MEVSRRKFLALTGSSAIGLALAACVRPVTPGQNTPNVITSPGVRPAISPSREQLTKFSTAVGSMYQDAYHYAKGQSGRSFDSPWTEEEVKNVWGRLSYVTQQLPSTIDSNLQSLATTINEKAYDKYFEPLARQYGGMHNSPVVEVQWMGRIQAMKDILEQDGMVVVHPIMGGWPPSISISADVETETGRQVNPMGDGVFPVTIHNIKKANIIIDTYSTLQVNRDGRTFNRKRQVAYPTMINGKREIYIYEDSLEEETNILLAIGAADKNKPKPFADDRNNPANNAEAVKIFNVAQNLINTTVGTDRSRLKGLQKGEAVAHESAHLLETHLPPHSPPHFEEARSYLEELRSDIAGLPRLALARMLYEISTKEVVDYVAKEGKYYDDPNTAGMELIIGDLVDVIAQDKTIQNKIGVAQVVSKKGGETVNLFCPYSAWNNQTIFAILSNMDKLTDSDLNKLAWVIKGKRATDFGVKSQNASGFDPARRAVLTNPLEAWKSWMANS